MHLNCGRLRPALVVAMAAAGLFAGAARAVVAQDGATIGSATPVIHFTGHSNLGGTILEPIMCPAQSADTSGTCDHVNMTATDDGFVHVALNFNPFDQFTLIVCIDNTVDPNISDGCMLGQEIARSDCSDDPAGNCTLDFPVTAGVNYDLVIVPQLALPGSPYSGQANFSTTSGGGTALFNGSSLKGSGLVGLPKFHINVGYDTKGKAHGDGVKFTNDHLCRFRSTSWSGIVSGVDTGDKSTTTGRANVSGTGRVKLGDDGPEQDVTYKADAEDNGHAPKGEDGDTMDTFSISVLDASGMPLPACSASGNLTRGQIRFQQK